MSESSANILDTGLAALVLMLRFHGIATDFDQLRHQLGSAHLCAFDLVRIARAHKLKSRIVETSWERLTAVALPAIAILANDTYVIIGRAGDDDVLTQDPITGRPSLTKRSDFQNSWTGKLIVMTKRSTLGALQRRFDIAWFLQAMHKYRGVLTEVLVASLFLQVFALVTPLFFQVVIDKVLVHRGMTTLDVLVVGLIGVSVFETVLSGLRTYVFSHTTNRIDVELGAQLFRHLLSLPISYFASRRTGDSVARVRELENIRNFITGSGLTVVVDLLFTTIFLAVMFYYSVTLTFVVVASFPFFVAISVGVAPLFRRRLDEKFERGAENQAFLVESVSGVETLKAMAVEPQMQRRWEEQLASYVSASFRVLSLANWASQSVQLVSKVVTATTLYFGAYLVINGMLTVGELVAFNMLSGRVIQPVLRLSQLWQDFHQTRVSIARLGDILNTTPEPLHTAGRATPPQIRGTIQFDHVSFRYRHDRPHVLHDICLTFPAGHVIGIVGASGSGKSTLTKLVQRLYVPENGRVLVDGIDLALIDVSWLRRQIGVVLQENVLFNRSIKDNIGLIDPGMPMERIVEAARLAGAHEFILELPEGYDTSVVERGANLSGGQRQRIAIARALVGNPRILIFDEATSSLDYESERIVQQNMKNIAIGRTVLIIAHRLSAVRFANRIITLDHGRVVEDGTHDDLIRLNGRYAHLHRLQAGTTNA